MELKSTLVLAYLLLKAFVVISQQSITGVIRDHARTALVGVNIQIEGTNMGTISDINGYYQISIPNDSTTLIYSFVGYTSIVEVVGGRKVIDVFMTEQASFLEEIVITGLPIGTATNKVGFSISKLRREQIQEVPAVNVAGALQSKIAGVQVKSAIGEPGSSADIRIRGSSNLFGEDSPPLIIVDGVQLQEPANLSDINTEDVETIEVVKGAAATSLYGSRAGGGVIHIMTKRGSNEPEKTEITFRNEFGASFLPRRINQNRHHHYTFNPDGSLNYDQIDADKIADNAYPVLYDQQDLLFESGRHMTNYLSIASRTQESNYFVSLNNTDQRGILPLIDGYQRQSIRANIDHKISKALKVRFSNFYSRSTSDEHAFTGVNSPFGEILFLPLSVNLLAPNEEDGSPYNWDAGLEANSMDNNPLYDLNVRENLRKVNRYSGLLGLEVSLFPSLVIDGSYSIDRRSIQFEEFVDKGYLPDVDLKDGLYRRESAARSYETASGKITFQRQYSEFKVVSQAAAIYELDDSESFYVEALDLRFSGIRSLSNSGNLSSSDLNSSVINRTRRGSEDFEVKTLNYYLTGSIDWKEKWILDGLVRFDGSSLFGIHNRWNTFFRTSLAYRLTEDVAIPKVEDLKLRASYGTAGNRPKFGYRFETLESDGTKNTLGNTDLRSSLKTELELGFDARLGNKISMGFTWARSHSTDLFFSVPLPAAAGGFQSQWQNIDSELEANSLEVNLNYEAINDHRFYLRVNLVFDRLRQQVNKFDFPDLFYQGAQIIRAGQPFGVFYMRKFARSIDDLFPHQLENKSYVVNHEGWLVERDKLGTVEEEPILIQEEDGNERFLQGNINPDFDLGLGLTLRWRRLQGYFLLHQRQGGHIYNRTKQWTFRDYRSGEIDQSARAQNEKKPVDYYSKFYLANLENNYFLEDGTYLKLREVALSYTFDTGRWAALGRIIKGIKFALIGRNLWTITDYSGYDPEVAYPHSERDANSDGYDFYGYPNFRTITGSLQFTF